MFNIGLPIKISDYNCCMCGFNPLNRIQGREFYCDVCEKRIIISTDYYGGYRQQIEELNEDTLLVRSR